MSKTRSVAMVVLGMILTLAGLAGLSVDNATQENLIVLAVAAVGGLFMFLGVQLFKSVDE